MKFRSSTCGHVNFKSFGMTMTCDTTVCVAKRAMTNASPRWPVVMTPSFEIFAAPSLLVRKSASGVTSRCVPSE